MGCYMVKEGVGGIASEKERGSTASRKAHPGFGRELEGKDKKERERRATVC